MDTEPRHESRKEETAVLLMKEREVGAAVDSRERLTTGVESVFSLGGRIKHLIASLTPRLHSF
jgi:hypothetical protein